MSVRYSFETRTRAPGAGWRVVAVFYTLRGAQAFVKNTELTPDADWRIIAC